MAPDAHPIRTCSVLRGLLFLCMPLCAQPVVPFQKLDVLAESPDPTVRVFYQDHRGLIWMGTRAGLYRYDGYETTAYHHDPESPGSLSADFITAIAEDDRNRLWVGTFAAGLNRQLREGNRFTSIENAVGGARVLTDNHILCLYRLRDGTLLAGTQRGIDRLRPGATAFEPIDPPADSLRGWVSTIHQDHAGRIWLGTRAGLSQLVDDQIRPGPLGDGSAFTTPVHVIEEIEDELWLGTTDGIYVLNRVLALQTHISADPASRHGLPGSTVTGLARGDSGAVWVTTFDGGAGVRWGDDRFSRLDTGEPNALDDRIATLFRDRMGALWFGSRSGPRLLDGLYDVVEHYRPGTGPTGTERMDVVHAIYRAEDGKTWLGTDGGLVITEPDGRHQIDRTGPRSVVWALAANGPDLWIGGLQGLFVQWDSQGPIEQIDRPVLRDVRALEIVGDGEIWVACRDTGLFRLDGLGNLARRVEPERGTWQERRIRTLLSSADETLLIGTHQGLFQLLPDQRKASVAPIDPPLEPNEILTLHQTADQTVWLGTTDGLIALDREAGRYRSRTYEAPGPVEVRSLASDEMGGLWLATGDGLGYLDPVRNSYASLPMDPRSLMRYTPGAVFADDKEGVLFGGDQGYHVLHQDLAHLNRQEPEVVITAVTVNDERLAFPEALRGGRLVLGHDTERLVFHFASTAYTSGDENLFAYRLHGQDSAWLETKEPMAVYTDPGTGHHGFEVKTRDRFGVWSAETVTVPVTVQTPPWLSGRAIAGYLLAIAFLIGAITYVVSQRGKAHRRLRESEQRLKWALWGSGDGLWDWQISEGKVHRTLLWEMLDYEAESSAEPLHFQEELIQSRSDKIT